MPTTRRRVDRHRSDRLSGGQQSYLELGFVAFAGEHGFESEAHAREAWEVNRDRIMAESCHPGRRPWAYWTYDWGLERVRDGNGELTFAWPEPIQSEEDMVYDLLKRGELEECKYNGAIRIDSEIKQIEEDWLRAIKTEVMFVVSLPKRTTPLQCYGVPVWFYEEHAPRIWAEEQKRWREFRDRMRPAAAES
jgi:hypothetical protein